MKIAVIGGGGISSLLSGLKEHDIRVTAIASVFDSGGSSGGLREEMDIAAVGDIRQCISSLSSPQTAGRLEERFSSGSLKGHTAGNLLLASLIYLLGDAGKAADMACGLFDVKGDVLPISADKSSLCAKLDDGRVIAGEANIDKPAGDEILKIAGVFLEPKAMIFPKARDAIEEADAIVIGPGDLYTSLIPNMLVEGFREAIGKSRAKKIYVCNLWGKRSESYGYTASMYADVIGKYMGCMPDYILCNTVAGKTGGAVAVDKKKLAGMGMKVIEMEFQKGLEHDGKKLAGCIMDIARKHMKLVIFDLDDTLFSRSLQIKGHLEADIEKEIEDIRLFPGAKDVLDAKGFRKALVTSGERERQEKKINVLGIRDKFDWILICEKDEDKKACFERIADKYGIERNNVFVAGNRIDSEIRHANMLGMQSILFVHGLYSDLEPKDIMEIPKYKIKKLSDILKIVRVKV
ncbi:MAG: uridine diphosphate-N-acetylglucosamine-binding protein YvcK [Candidatus Aenigmarchaeota archaeon]|nr:uridine diphosphate-N-acetylglucosamine-binding protein YvcK [Candidatus Aenigmarchaeota archaeon]